MLARNWGLLLAILAAAIVTPLLWTNLEPRQPDLPPYEYGEGAAADYKTGGTGCEPKVLASIRDNGKAAIERQRCSEAAEEHRLKRDDLVQQTRAADAAKAQALTNYDLARMGLWGTIGGFLTLIAASLAAYYARDAAKASRETVKAFVAVERPRLILSVGNCWQDGETTYFSLRGENVGKTSAFAERAAYNTLDDRFPDRPFRLVDELAVPVHMGKKVEVWTIGSDVKRHKIPYIGGYIEYRSPFGERHKSYFCVRLTYRPNDSHGGSNSTAENSKGDDWPEDT